jgi:predicted Rossmann fold flavoprotein
VKIIIIGGGAAGFFTAINIAEKHPDYQVSILEKSGKILQKVKVSGGGRCNVTNERSLSSELVKFYPRGSKKLHSLFKTFSSDDMVNWLANHGVQTKAEADKRMFPISDSSQTIIDCFVKATEKNKVTVHLNEGLNKLEQNGQQWKITTSKQEIIADKVVIATGSSPATWKVLEETGLEITDIVPSLFTFNIRDPRIQDLMGVAFEKASVKVTGTKLIEEGPLLITHWGLSGPAILKLSAWGAYDLHDKKYAFEVLINYLNLMPDEARQQIQGYKAANPKRKAINYPLFELPKRFWEQMIGYCEIPEHTPFGELSKKQVNKLIEELCQGRYEVNGKSTFKEEFVTAGGINLSEVDLNTFECKRFPNLYLAGEVLDIDALTGGFNFQACWSAGWVISESV